MKLCNIILLAGFIFGCSSYAEEAYTHAIKVQTLLKTTTDSAGRLIEYPVGGDFEMSELLVEIPAGQNTGWHVHPNPCFAHVLEGTFVVEYADGVKRAYKAGDSFVEAVNLKHCGTNTGIVPVKILVCVIGKKDIPISVK